jgi:hypothetical protein
LSVIKQQQILNNSLIALTIFLILSRGVFGQALFHDDFESDLRLWEYQGQGIAQVIKTEDLTHKSVLKLSPNKTAECILIKDSDKWESIVIKGQVLFPTDKHDYLGLVYNYHEADRIDFGCIYIKGKGSYIRANPHRDGNASRALYEEYKTALNGKATIKVNQWYSFKAEIIGSECHFYVTDMEVPKVVFKYFEYPKGKIGFKPRLAGGDVWVDNISVDQIEDFSYSAPIESNGIEYRRDLMINEWKALGPFNQRIAEVELSEGNAPAVLDEQAYNWADFATDYRGCVIAGKICRYSTDQKFAYFSTYIDSEENREAEIQFSSLNNLHIWVNSKYLGSIEAQKYAWFDYLQNPKHAGNSLPISLRKGTNRILVLVEGANYSGDGFYSYIMQKD